MNIPILQFANAVRYRYQVAHLNAKAKSREIVDDAGDAVGFLDTVSVASGRLRVSGWIRGGAKVTLTMHGNRVECTPSLFREDVAAVFGIGPQVGFDLTLPTTPAILQNHNPAGIIFELADPNRPVVHPISIPLRGLNLKLHLLNLKLLASIPSVAAPLIKWSFTRDGISKHRVISGLGMDRTPMGASQILDASVFEPLETDSPNTTQGRVTIVLPVFNAFDLLPDVVERVLANTDLPFHLLIINDASTDEKVWPWLQSRIAKHRQSPERIVTLLNNDTNLGFIGTVNRGLRIAQEENPPCPEGISEGPIILLNSDAFVPANWASRLVAPMWDQDDVATTTPMSNDAEIFSIPKICTRCDLRPGDADAIDAVASELNSLASDIEVPTGVGFCMAIARDWVTQVGNLDTVFGRGYGEEVDWCQRARIKGARHLAVRNLFVEHRGGASFGSADKMAMVTKNNRIVSGRYPDYNEDVQFFIHSDPMLMERLVLGVAWADRQARAAGGTLSIYLAHSLGGGAEIHLKQQIADDVDQLGGAIVIRVGGEARWQIELHTPEGITLGGTMDADVVRKVLGTAEKRHVVYSCGVGDPNPDELPALLKSLKKTGDRLTVLVHDFFMVSPSYTLTDSDGFFVTTPLAKELPDDPAHQFPLSDGSHISLETWQSAWGALMSVTDEVTTFSKDSAKRISEVYPDTKTKITVKPHSLSFTPQPVKAPKGDTDKFHIGVLGGINRPKGALVLQELSQRIADKTLDAKLTLIGEIDPTVPLTTSATIHGAYTREFVSELAEDYGITHWLIPSVWPETFSFTTHEAIATKLPVLTFDLGAQAEAAARASNGHLVPFAQSELGKGDLIRQLVDNIINSMHSHASKTGSEPS